MLSVPLNWPGVVRDLAQGTRLPELPTTFPVNATIDEQLRARVTKLEEEFTLGSPLPHEPALVEPLLGDIAALLDRCMAYQRDASELEIKWIRQQLDSQLSTDVAPLELQLSINGLGEPSASEAKRAHEATAAEFKNVALQPLAAGFAEEATGSGRVARVAIETAQAQQKLLEARSARIAAYRAALDSRHSAPGGAHNYLERYERITRLLFEDFDEAYRKSKCVVLGLGSVFGIVRTLPDLNTDMKPSPVFALISWVRSVMRELEVFAETELEYEVALPLVQPFQQSDGGSAGSAKSLVSKAEYIAAINAVGAGGRGKLAFTLGKLGIFRVPQTRLRVVGVGLSFVISDVADDALLNYRLFATLIPPEQAVGFQAQGIPPAQTRHRPAIVIGNVFPYGPQMQVARVQGLSIHNLQPFGEWKLFVHPYGIGAGTGTQKLVENSIIDFRLHLTIVSQPSTEVSLGG